MKYQCFVARPSPTEKITHWLGCQIRPYQHSSEMTELAGTMRYEVTCPTTDEFTYCETIAEAHSWIEAI